MNSQALSTSDPAVDSGNNGILSARLLNVFVWATGFYFLLRLVYFAIAIHHSIPPDEVTHFDRVSFFSTFFLLPSGTTGDGNAHLWITRYHPPVYYLLAGKFLLLNVFSMSDILFTRLLSVGLSCGTVFYGWRFIKVLSPKPLVHFLFLIMMTNTLMFSFLSAAITYDSLVNLLAAASMFYMTTYFKTREPGDFLCLLIALLLGTLTKVTMLPFCFAVAIVVLVHERKELKQGLVRLVGYWYSAGIQPKILCVVTVVFLGLNGMLYGNNLLTFGHLIPKSEQVMSESDIKSHTVASRAAIYMDYLSGECSFEESIAKAKEIGDHASSLDTINLLKYGQWRQETQGPFEPMSRVAYVVPWSKTMLVSTFGIMGHSVAYKSLMGHLPYLLVFAIAGLFFVVRGFQGHSVSYEYLYIGMFVFYTLVLMQAVNYKAYLSFQLPHISVQGRYLFPLILPVYGLTAKYLLSFGTARLQSIIVVVTVLFYLYGDFPFFLNAWGNGPW